MTTTKGLDWSFGTVPVESMKQWGYTHAFRYLSWSNPDTYGKILRAPELAHILSVGVDVFANWEFYSTRANEGAVSGAVDGRECHRQLLALGWPAGAMVIVSNDTGSYYLPNVIAYRDAFKANCPGFDVRMYGGYDFVESMHAHDGSSHWQTRAWSRGLLSPHAFAYQNGNQAFNGAADENIIYDTSGSYRSHWPKPSPQPNPAWPVLTTGDDEMAKPYIHGMQKTAKVPYPPVYVVSADLTSKVHILGTADLSGLMHSGQYLPSPLTDAQVSTIPEVKK